MIVTSSSDEKLERAKRLGAWKGINYKENPAWARVVKELTDGEGADLIVEVGGAGTLQQSLVAVRFGGQVSLIGNVAGGVGEIKLYPIFMRQIRVQGILVGSREGFEAMNRAIAQHELRPVVDRVFPFEQAREAMEYLGERRHFGKVCLRFE